MEHFIRMFHYLCHHHPHIVSHYSCVIDHLRTVEHIWSFLIEDDGLPVDVASLDGRDEDREAQQDDHDGVDADSVVIRCAGGVDWFHCLGPVLLPTHVTHLTLGARTHTTLTTCL